MLELLAHPFELGLLLGHTSANADDQIRVALLKLAQHMDLAVHFAFGIFTYAARVVQDQVGLDRRGDPLVADLLQHAEHDLRVVLVHLAAQGLDPNAFRTGLLPG